MADLTVPTAGPRNAAQFSGDINAAIAKAALMLQSVTAPTTASTGLASLAGVWWHDTTSQQIKLRDQADTAWITVAQLDETGKTATPVIATQAQMEAAASLAALVTPARQHFHPAHPKAVANFSLSATALSGAIVAVDIAGDVITWSTAHGLATGDFITSTNGVWPSGWTNGHYVRVLTATTFTAHPTYEDAQASTSRLDLTSGGSGTRSAAKLNVTVNFGFGLAATAPVRPVAGAYLGGPAADSPQVRIYWAGALSSVNAFLGQATGGASSFGGCPGNGAAKAASTAYAVLDWQTATQTWANVTAAGTNTGFSFLGDLV